MTTKVRPDDQTASRDLEAVDSSADQSVTIDCEGWGVLWVQVYLKKGGSPAIGTIKALGSLRGERYVDAIYLDANKVYGPASFAGGSSVAANASSADVDLLFAIAKPPQKVKIAFTHSSGGGAGELTIDHYFTGL